MKIPAGCTAPVRQAGEGVALAALVAAAVLVPLGLVGCTSLGDLLNRGKAAQQPVAPASDASATEGEAEGNPTASKDSEGTHGPDEIWSDPSFQRRLAESYAAETEVEPRVTFDEREQLLRIFKLMEQKKYDEALRQIERRRRDKTASAVFDFTLANIRFQQGNDLEVQAQADEDAGKAEEATQKKEQAKKHYPESAAAYLVAVDKFPKFLRAWKNLGLVHVRQKDYEKALPALTRAVELGGGDATTYGLLGYCYSDVNNNVAAESAYRMAILMDGRTMDWKMGLVRSLFKQGRFADVTAMCDRLIADHPDSADLWMLQANAHIRLGEPLKAAENYEVVSRLGKSTVESLNMLGDIYVNEEIYDLAVRSYLGALARSPAAKVDRAVRAAKVLTARTALAETRDLIDGIGRLRGGQLSPEEQKDLLKLQARLAVAEHKGDEEVRVLEQIVEIDPLDGEALILLGQHYGGKDDTEKAILYFERAERMEKYEADALVRHAQLLVNQKKDYEGGAKLLRRAQQIKPRDNVQQYLEQVERIAKAR